MPWMWHVGNGRNKFYSSAGASRIVYELNILAQLVKFQLFMFVFVCIGDMEILRYETGKCEERKRRPVGPGTEKKGKLECVCVCVCGGGVEDVSLYSAVYLCISLFFYLHISYTILSYLFLSEEDSFIFLFFTFTICKLLLSKFFFSLLLHAFFIFLHPTHSLFPSSLSPQLLLSPSSFNFL